LRHQRRQRSLTISHRLSGPHRTEADSLDIRRILTCGYGFWRTGWTDGIDLRIRRSASHPSVHVLQVSALEAVALPTEQLKVVHRGTAQGHRDDVIVLEIEF